MLIFTQKVCAGGLYFGFGSGFPLSKGRKNCSGCRRCSITQEIPSQSVSKQVPSVWCDSMNNFMRCNHPLNLWHPFSMSVFCFTGNPFKTSKGSGSKVRKRGWSDRFLSKHLWVLDWKWMYRKSWIMYSWRNRKVLLIFKLWNTVESSSE